MKQLVTLLFLLTVTISSKAQFTAGSYTNTYFQNFLKSTTYIQLTGDSLFDLELQKTMERFWKITPFKFLEMAKFNSLVKQNTDASFLGFIRQTVDYLTKGTSYTEYATDAMIFQITMGCASYPEACGSMGDKGQVARFTWQKLQSRSGDKTVDNDKMLSEYYRLPDIINSMQKVIMITRDEKLKLYQFKDYRYDFVKQVLCRDASALTTKTLYVLKDDLRADVDLAKAKSNYPYKLKIVTLEELKKAIISEDKNVVYMANNDECGPSFYDIETHLIVGAMNYGPHDKFRTQDFKDIAEFVKKNSKKK